MEENKNESNKQTKTEYAKSTVRDMLKRGVSFVKKITGKEKTVGNTDNEEIKSDIEYF